MQLVTLEISDDYYDKFLHVVDALPSEKIQFKSKSSSMTEEIDSRIDDYLKNKSVAVDFTSSMHTLKEKLLATAK
ncbi:MAG: hypothetical protein L3J43_03425 [Sulfurovum sp.]|nr:hypothetical protein [Sulfurovum sp.]